LDLWNVARKLDAAGSGFDAPGDIGNEVIRLGMLRAESGRRTPKGVATRTTHSRLKPVLRTKNRTEGRPQQMRTATLIESGGCGAASRGAVT
jgi:hypothetical protein